VVLAGCGAVGDRDGTSLDRRPVLSCRGCDERSLGAVRPRLFLFFAIFGHFLERVGATHCGCAPDCWCKPPGLALFRWVIPYGHR
jgi:hypothetical protein